MINSIGQVLGRICRRIGDELGYPDSLQHVLQNNPNIGYLVTEGSSIDYQGLTRWHTWSPGERIPRSGAGKLHGWKYIDGEYRDHSLTLPALAEIGWANTIDDFSCDIRQVLGLSSSKSQLNKFADLDAFALSQCSEYTVAQSCPALVDSGLEYGEVRITSPGLGDSFSYFAWDHRIFLMNSGGSHHFATARYHAGQCGYPVELRAPMTYCSLDVHSVRSLCHQFHIFSVNHDAHVQNAISAALKSARVSWYWGRLPAPHCQNWAYFFPKGEARSNRAAEIFRKAGIPDLGEHLVELVMNQSGLPSGPILAYSQG